LVLYGIYKILKMSATEDVEKVCVRIEDCEGRHKIISFKNNEDIEIDKIAKRIVKNYFSQMVSSVIYIFIFIQELRK